MVDHHARPASGPGAWPGRADAVKLKTTSRKRAELVESALLDDSSETAPSKRILSRVKHYERPFHGELALEMITLEKAREECPHFDRWLRRLEQRASTQR